MQLRAPMTGLGRQGLTTPPVGGARVAIPPDACFVQIYATHNVALTVSWAEGVNVAGLVTFVQGETGQVVSRYQYAIPGGARFLIVDGADFFLRFW